VQLVLHCATGVGVGDAVGVAVGDTVGVGEAVGVGLGEGVVTLNATLQVAVFVDAFIVAVFTISPTVALVLTLAFISTLTPVLPVSVPLQDSVCVDELKLQ
jgi:hypothetical protein